MCGASGQSEKLFFKGAVHLKVKYLALGNEWMEALVSATILGTRIPPNLPV